MIKLLQMLALFVVLGILLVLVFIAMTTMMVIFERDKPKNIVIWVSLFLITQFVGYIVYFCSRLVFHNKKLALNKKQKEDEIYLNLINSSLLSNNVTTEDEFYKFNERAYSTRLTTHNGYEIINNLKSLKEDLLKEIKDAKSLIVLEFRRFNFVEFEDVKNILIKKARSGVKVRMVCDNPISRKISKELISAGIKIHRFSKLKTLGKVYSNLRNVINIDNRVCFIGNWDLNIKETNGKFEVADLYLKLTGEVVQDIGLSVYQDAIFASNKFIEFPQIKFDERKDVKMQFVFNEIETNMEWLIINAISHAKKSIQLQLKTFIPTESILSLLRYAINTGIEVRLMVPLKVVHNSKYFASRAYAKDLALSGANVYLYDGYIRYNAITIDDQYILTGCFILDREHISTALQNILIVEDKKAVNYFNRTFDDCINNSYRISNAKYMLIREKFFKNFT